MRFIYCLQISEEGGWRRSRNRNRWVRGISTLAFLVFCAALLIPLLLLALGIGRYMHARAVLQSAADAAALAAAQDVDAAWWEMTGELRFVDPWALDEAYGYVMQNAEWLVVRGIYPRVAGTYINHAQRTIRVVVEADCSPLFFEIPVVLRAEATAEVAPVQEIFPHP
ncbi:MAG: pilus assembly protein TadG-related protein [Thermoproteota archaeon]